MAGHQTATINDTVFFWFASNDTSGSGGDGATPLFDVREAGAAASAAPLLSGTPSLLSNAAYPAGCHEVSVAATTGNGFAADDTFAVFCTLAIDSQNPSGFVGSCTLTPLAKAAALAIAQTDLDTITGTAGALIDDGTGAGQIALTAGAIDNVTLVATTTISTDAEADIAALNDVAATDIVSAGAITTLAGAIVNVDLVDTTTTNSDMRGTDSALLAASAPTNFGDMSITVTTGLVDITQTAADKAWGTAVRILTASTNFNDIAAGEVWAVDATTEQTQGTFGQAIGDPIADTTTIYQAVATDATGDNVAVDVVAIKAETVVIESQTDDIGVAGAGLTAINLPNQTMDIVGNITGNLSGSVGSVTADVGITATAVDNIWDEDIVAAHNTADTAGAILNNILPESNAAFNDIEYLWVAASDHVTPVTGATTTSVTRSIDGGAFGAGTGTLAEVGNGIYQYDASAADMNGTIITFRFVATGGTPGAPDDAFVTLKTSG